jgi:hypothetical protein
MSEPSQVHIAGPTLTVGTVRRQRCVWCGALLDEHDLAMIARPLEPGEDPENPEPWEPGAWEVGGLVRTSGTFPRVGEAIEAERHDDGSGAFRIPEDSCMALDAEVTA